MPQYITRSQLMALVYADVFDYPLKNNEIEKWKINIKSHRSLQFFKAVKNRDTENNLYSACVKKGYFYLTGREKIVNLRQKKENYSRQKHEIARRIASVLKYLPLVKLIGLTGSLAVNNSDKNDDIDLLIITKKGCLWTTRLLVTLLVELSGRRRHPDDKEVSDKVCLNMFISENYLCLPAKERDLFSAHEVVQMKPLFDRDDTYNKFLAANRWVRKYLPNAIINIKNNKSGSRDHRNKLAFFSYLANPLLNLIEELSKWFQYRYMKKKITREVLGKGMLKFHSQDHRKIIMDKYFKGIENVGLSINNLIIK